jgi:ABC-type branched-subunit amino acid transport system ATPase component
MSTRFAEDAQPAPTWSASDRSPEPLLEIADLTLAFGGIRALDGVGFTVEAGSITGLIGPNGAGKTTLFNCLSSLYTPDSGDIRFAGRSISENCEPPEGDRAPAAERAPRGAAGVPRVQPPREACQVRDNGFRRRH